MTRLRIAHVIVQPVLVHDDGDELSPGPQVKPITVPLSALDGMADRLRDEVAQIEDPEVEDPQSATS